MAERIGLIGLGIMGKPMGKNLLKAGLALTVWNRSAGTTAKVQVGRPPSGRGFTRVL